MDIKNGLVVFALGAFLGAVYNTSLNTPWAEDLTLLHQAYQICERDKARIAQFKNINPERFNTCSVFFYYDVTESSDSGRYLHAFSADASHAKWVEHDKKERARIKKQAEIDRSLAEEDKRAEKLLDESVVEQQ